MILSSLCELASREGLLEDRDYEPKPVAWILVVGEGGRFVNLVPTVSGDGKKARAKTFSIPRRAGRTSGAFADFLVDNSEYVLGVKPAGKSPKRDPKQCLELFRERIHEARTSTREPALAAVEAFLSDDAERRRAVERINSDGYNSNDLFAFEYDGELVHDLAGVRRYFAMSRRAGQAEGAQCLVCGAVAAPAEKHPGVRVPGGSTSGVAIVSFNSDAFESYGLDRNQNAPVCRDCAEAYTTALNRLLSDRYPDPRNAGQMLPRRHYRLSPDTTAVYWSDREAAVVDLFSSYFDAPKAESVRELFASVHKGRRAGDIGGRFYCLILSGGQGRAVLRSAHTGTVEEVAGNIASYFEMVGGSDEPLPLMRLLRSLVLLGDSSNLAPGLVTDVFVAIVFGRLFPRTLLTSAVGRCRAERKVTRERAAVLRAYLKKNERREIRVGLDKESKEAGYRLGRLMAVLERAERAARNNPDKTIVDRYYGAASTRPAVVFPRLVAMAQHHLASLADRGRRVSLQKQLGEVMDGIDGFPVVLAMEEQGMFALGYYHQRQDFFKKGQGEVEPAEEQAERGEMA